MNENTIRDAISSHEHEIYHHDNEIRRLKKKLERCKDE